MSTMKPYANKQSEIISLLDTVSEANSLGFTKITPNQRKNQQGVVGGTLYLPLPSNLQIQTQYDWSIENTGAIANQLFNNGLSGKGASELAEFFLQRGGNFIANQVSANAASLFMQERGVALNPQEKVFFKSSRHRTFDYEWSIACFSQKQADSFWKGVDILHQNAAPGFAGSEGYLFTVPSTFEFIIYTKQGGSTNALTQATCAITSIGTSLTPDGFWSTFKDGTPTRISLSVNFTELSIPIANATNANPFKKGNTGNDPVHPLASTNVGSITMDDIAGADSIIGAASRSQTTDGGGTPPFNPVIN